MSRREDRSSESKRRDPRLRREPSPKRSRRDGKPETERLYAERDLDKDRVERDHKQRHRLQDTLPPISHDSKVESEITKKESENRTDRYQGGSKHSSDPSKVPQSRSYSKHDDRGSWQSGRGLSPWTDTERGERRDPMEQQNDGGINKTVSIDAQQRDQKTKNNREDNHVRRHDGYVEMGVNPKPRERKRHSFREQKPPLDPQKTTRATADLMTPNPQNNAADNGRSDERRYTHRHSDIPERPFGRDSMGNSSSRDRFTASNRYSGRDRATPRQGHRPSGGRVEKWKHSLYEKWKHDLYDKDSKSPTPENEEERIKKIEALLTS